MNRSLVLAARAASVLLSIAALAGCTGNNVQLGGSSSGSSGGSSGGDPEGTTDWHGYVENYQFASGSDAIALHLDPAMGTSVTGQARFGDAPDLPPATDPDVGYPSDLPAYGTPVKTQEGFDFTLENATLSTDRIQFSVLGDEVWNTWCSLQTPVLSQGADPPFYGCLPNSYTPDPCTAGGVSVDCGKLRLCTFENVCTCDASGCVGAGSGKLDFDLSIEGDKAHGSVTGLQFGAVLNVWLTRDAD
jgi:hypothetical protein